MITSKERNLSKTDNFIETEIDGDRVIMQIENGYFFTMNSSAEAVWTRINGTASQSDIVTEVAEYFDVSTNLCEADIEEFIQELKDNKLVNFD